jgi:multiple antibiotic resistance protein
MSFFAILSLIFLSLLPIVNPIGMSSVFLGMSSNLSPHDRHKLAYKVAVYSAALLIGILFLGPLALSFFGLTLPFIRIAGGLLVSFTAWQMLNAKPKLSEEEEEEHAENEDLAFFPLTLPITAGAGAIAITISIAVDIDSGFSFHVAFQYLGAVIGIILMMTLVYVCYRFADTILNKIGRTGTMVVTRLSAFVLLAIGINVIWAGLLKLIIIAKAAK